MKMIFPGTASRVSIIKKIVLNKQFLSAYLNLEHVSTFFIQSFPDEQTLNETPKLNTVGVLELNCSQKNIKCAFFNCTVGPFESWQNYAEFSVDIQIDFQVVRANIAKCKFNKNKIK